jgi:hypothetical protein
MGPAVDSGPRPGGAVTEGSFRVPEHVSAREVEGELVILDLESGTFHVARGLGPRVWEMLAEGRSTEHVVREVAGRYGEDGARVRADVHAFVEALLSKGLLERR